MNTKRSDISILRIIATLAVIFLHTNNTILNNLKSTLMNKNNMVISSEDVQKIKNYTEDVKRYY